MAHMYMKGGVWETPLFIVVHSVNDSSKEILVNTNDIVEMWDGPKNESTIISLSNGRTYQVKESLSYLKEHYIYYFQQEDQA